VRRAVILLYHRVTELAADPQLLSVSPQHFAEHLDVIRKVGLPMPLKSLWQDGRRERSSKCDVIVTFDDGYADNLYNAKPLLESHDVPATVFVSSKGILAGRTRENISATDETTEESLPERPRKSLSVEPGQRG
jgi:peptidoglycan/xylan/chitin deacetylase (PgdA/CDA1 family)